MNAMDRRQLLAILGAGPMANAARGADAHCTGDGVGSTFEHYEFVFFTPEERELLDELVELIIPADEQSPGAREAKVTAFADRMISTAPESARKLWRDGLGLIREMTRSAPLSTVLAGAAAQEEHPQKTLLGRFFVALKRMTVDGYYTSSIGIHQDLQYRGNEYRTAAPDCDHPEHKDPSTRNR